MSLATSVMRASSPRTTDRDRLERAGHDRHRIGAGRLSRRDLVARGLRASPVSGQRTRCPAPRRRRRTRPARTGSRSPDGCASAPESIAAAMIVFRDQVAFRCRRRSDTDRDVGGPDMERIDVCIAVHGDRLHVQFPAGPDDPECDLTPVRDEDPPERRPDARFRHPGRPKMSGRDPGCLCAKTPRPIHASRFTACVVTAGCCRACGTGSVSFALQHPERTDDPRSRLGWHDHVIDVSPARRDIRVGERVLVLAGELDELRVPDPRHVPARRGR